MFKNQILNEGIFKTVIEFLILKDTEPRRILTMKF